MHFLIRYFMLYLYILLFLRHQRKFLLRLNISHSKILQIKFINNEKNMRKFCYNPYNPHKNVNCTVFSFNLVFIYYLYQLQIYYHRFYSTYRVISQKLHLFSDNVFLKEQFLNMPLILMHMPYSLNVNVPKTVSRILIVVVLSNVTAGVYTP